MSAATDASARAFGGHRARAKVPSRPRRACRAVHASRESVRASVESSSHRADQASTPSRRDTLVGLTSAFSAAATAALAPPEASAAVKLTPGGLDPNRRFFQTFPTVVKLRRTGGLVVFAPQAPTAEFFKLLDELGEVEHVVLPTYAIEHKVWLPALARRYRDAKVWVADGLWSVPVDLPNTFLGINPTGVLVPSGTDRRFPNGRGDANDPTPANPQPPWLDELEYKVLRVDTAGANPYIEAVFLHKASRTLLVTDLVFSIPTDPPAVIDRDRLLNLAPDDPKDAPAPMSDDALRAGWAKASLVVSFLGPSRQSQVEAGAFKGKLRWEPGWERSFAAIENRVLPSPILRTLVFSKGKGPTRRFLEELRADWGDAFDEIVPAHYDAPVKGTAADVAAAFSFLDAPDFLTGLASPGAELPEEDMGTLLKVNDVLELVGLGKGSE